MGAIPSKICWPVRSVDLEVSDSKPFSPVCFQTPDATRVGFCKCTGRREGFAEIVLGLLYCLLQCVHTRSGRNRLHVGRGDWAVALVCK